MHLVEGGFHCKTDVVIASSSFLHLLRRLLAYPEKSPDIVPQSFLSFSRFYCAAMSPKPQSGRSPQDRQRVQEAQNAGIERQGTHTGTTSSPPTHGDSQPLRPHTEAWRQVCRLLQHSADAGPHPPHPEESLVHQTARVRALLGHALIERGIQLTSGQADPRMVAAMLHPAFFSSLWMLANGYPPLETELQRIPGYNAWLWEAIERGRLPTCWGPPEILPREEGAASTAGSTETNSGDNVSDIERNGCSDTVTENDA